MDIPSTSNTGCFDFALDDYLHSYHTSSSNSTSCFDLAFDCLVEFDCLAELKKSYYSGNIGRFLKYLRIKVRLLKIFFLYAKKCRRRRNCEALLEHDQEDKGNIISESLRFRIQDVIIKMIHDLQSTYLLYKHSGEPDLNIVHSALTRSLENIIVFLETDIKKSCSIIFFNYYSPGDPRLVMDLIESLLETLECHLFGHHMEPIRQKLMPLRNLIRFATVLGVECEQLIDLLTHVAVVAAHLISVCQFVSDRLTATSVRVDTINQMAFEIHQMIHKKINPLDPQTREIYIHVLAASKKQSRSLNALVLEENEHPVVVEFVSSLLDYLMDLLGSYASFQVLVKGQMLKLYQGIKYLSILLKREEKLGDKIKDLIGVVVCDAGILIFSLSVNEIKEGLPKDTEIGLFHLHRVLKYLMAEVAHNYPLTSPYSSFHYPRCNELCCMDFFLENLKELGRSDEADDSIVFLLDRIQMVQEDLLFLRSFLENIKDQRYHDGKLQAFWSHVMEATYKVELLIDSTLVGDNCQDSLVAVANDINCLKIKALEIQNGQTQRVNKTSIQIPTQLTATTHNEDLVGLDDAVETITHRLTRGSKQLDVVPIVGMPGLGKTTLANKVYTAPSVRSHFHVCGWCCVSQTYSTRILLVQLLCSISSKSTDGFLEMDENDLALQLKQVLLRTRYLLVLDDLWDVEAWNLLEKLLPNDVNGSRILFTSRFQNLSLQSKPDIKSYHLRQLTDEESWTLLQKKLFHKENCPPTLSKVGSRIAKSCRGLPLTIVLVAGILANTAQDCWEEVAKCLSSSVLDNEYCMKTLELSYGHLPDYLKPCLLYFGAFKEDEVINVRRLLWRWISEGFVQQTEGKSLEEVAYDHLMSLINRSLVLVSRQRTRGGVQACQIHDLVYEFCVEKSNEESFLHIIDSWKDPFSLTGPSNPHRVYVHNTRELKIWELMLIFPSLRSLLLFGDNYCEPKVEDLGILLPKLLRVLDLGDLKFYESFPMEVLLLVHLRHLALCKTRSIPAAIDNLSRLETLTVNGPYLQIVLPDAIWNIKTLSNLSIEPHGTKDYTHGFIFRVGNLEVYPNLDHLNTLNLVIDSSSKSLQKLLTKLPSIRRLKCAGPVNLYKTTKNCDEILEFDCLSQLESLRLIRLRGYGFKFPLNLKKLVLSWNSQPWTEISKIGKLPNLEVLKLLNYSFVGEEWVMKEGEFPNLRVLELLELGIRNWTAFSDSFSRLEKLVVHSCPYLEKVPSCLGECETLEMIEVKWCRMSVVNSIKQIQQEQIDMGNEDLKIVLEGRYEYDTSISSEAESIPSEAGEISSERESISSHHT
ncbi:putative late blight resistance protein homolog R1A-3 [Coffea arabica]|uniref:Late blight resistance protein homolog R1A-3 n=1 Tax=Coffea arabica TaxID=13443 RepID=A0A6P6TF47_COFAR|nr:putative late blight resistance protein homolog R1A-3 [Coffea arabica]